jgi:cell division protein FtsZ
MLKFEHPKEQSNIIKVIGVGGGGSNAVTHMYHQGIKGVDFVLCNTDAQALEISPVPNKIHLGKRQLGAGNMPAVGREAAIETITEIKELLEPHTKMLFITAGMGGGTGTGAAPVVAQVARELDILTVGIVTLPFSFEGKKRRQQAIEGIEELRKYVDTLLIISNDKLREEYGNMRLTEAFKKADDVLTTASKGIAEIITVTGYINVDFEDVRTVMQNSGKAIMGSAKAEGENRALKAIEDAMRSPLLNDSNIVGAKNILLYITSGEIEISLDEVHEITDYIQHICGNTAEVIWGNGVDESLGNNIAISVIATGFDNEENLVLTPGNTTTKVTHLYGPQETTPKASTEKDAARTPVKVHTLLDEEPKEQITESKTTTTAINTLNQNAAIVHRLFDQPETSEADSPAIEEANEVEASTPEIAVFKKINFEADDIFLEITNPQDLHQPMPNPVSFSLRTSQSNDDGDKLEMERKSLERQARLKALSLKIKTNEGLEELERQPAYMRKGTEIKFQDDEQDLSRYSINNDPMRPGLRSDNSFLHDNVD